MKVPHAYDSVILTKGASNSEYFHSMALQECLYDHPKASIHNLLRFAGTHFVFDENRFWFCLTGLKKVLYNGVFHFSAERYFDIFLALKEKISAILFAQNWNGEIFLAWKADEKQIAIIMSPQPEARCSAEELADVIDRLVQQTYEQKIFCGDTRYRNATALVGPLSGYEAIRKGYHSARALNDLSFLHMDDRIFTEASVCENRRSADYPTILDACFELRSRIDEGSVGLAEQHLCRLFLHTIRDSYSLALCDDALSFIKSMLQVRSIVYGLQTETPLETLCAREHYHKVEDCVEVLLPIVRALCDAVHRQGAYSKPVLSALYYIKMHFSEYLVLTDIARYANINATYLSSKFKEETGVSVRHYITCVRLNEARRLLLSGNDTVSSIAKAIGFEDVRYFTRVFKAHMYCTPTEYRRKTE